MGRIEGIVAKKTPKTLSTSLSVPQGRYHVHVRRAKELSFEAFLEPISHEGEIAPPTEVVVIT